MTKRDIARRVTFETGIEMTLAARVVQRVMDSITKSLATGEGIELRGFGVFDVVMSKGRIGRNPKTGEPVVVAPRARVRYAVGKEMGAKVKGAVAVKQATFIPIRPCGTAITLSGAQDRSPH